jgi:signal transduction histidine kinase
MAREEERRVLHRNLHDRIGPALAGLRLKIEAARNRLGSDPATGDQFLAEAAAQTQFIAGEIQSAIYHLRPPALDQLGLVEAIRNHPLTSSKGSATQLRVDLEAPEPFPPLPAAVEVAAYHIAMEALNNVVRHARASACHLALSLITTNKKPCLRLQICDDGLGLSPYPRSGVGIPSMRERAEELSGTFQVGPGPNGAGTCVMVDLPFPKLQG